MSVQRYQLAIDEAKVQLNLAVCPGTWLMPGRMVMNTESVVGYHNKLKQAGVGIKLGIKKGGEQGQKKATLHLMAGGKSKINPPNNHPSNTIHKASTTEKAPAAEPTPTVQTQSEPTPPACSGSDSYDNNKITVAVGALAIAGLLFLSLR